MRVLNPIQFTDYIHEIYSAMPFGLYDNLFNKGTRIEYDSRGNLSYTIQEHRVYVTRSMDICIPELAYNTITGRIEQETK